MNIYDAGIALCWGCNPQRVPERRWRVGYTEPTEKPKRQAQRRDSLGNPAVTAVKRPTRMKLSRNPDRCQKNARTYRTMSICDAGIHLNVDPDVAAKSPKELRRTRAMNEEICTRECISWFVK